MTSCCANVEFPPYCSLFRRKEKVILIGGGGGTARTGVRNFIDVLSAERGKFETLASLEMDDAVMWIGAADATTGRIFYSVGSAIRTALLRNEKIVDDEECLGEALMKTGEFLTTACVSSEFLIVGTNQGRIYGKNLRDQAASLSLVARENASIEHAIVRGDHFLVCHSSRIMELRWSNDATFSTSLIFSSKGGRIKRIVADGESSVIFLAGNYLRSTDRRKCRLRSDGTAIAILPEAGLVAVGMLDGHVSVHTCRALDEVKVLRPVNSLVTSLTFLSEQVDGVELCVTSLDDKICRCFVKYGEVANSNFLIHIVIMLIIVTGHAIVLVFLNPAESTSKAA